jgi:amino acid transporter
MSLFLEEIGGTDAARKNKGLRGGALGLVSSVVVGVASTAPAYSLAATLGFVVILIGITTPIVAILAFVPMFCVALAFKEMNKVDPDCGTSFTWAARAFGPRTGWITGWGVIAADVLCMASLGQIAAQYMFLLFNNSSIGANPSSGWVLLLGCGWIAAMTVICYIGIEVSANMQKVLLSIEFTMLIVLSVVALIKVGNGTAPVGHLPFSFNWLNPFKSSSLSSFANGILLMLFIYWGWDSAVNVNEEAKDPTTVPGKAAVYSTLLLLGIFALVTISVQSYAGLGTHGIGLGNPAHSNDVLSILGSSVFGTNGFGSVLSHLLLLMVLSSAAASTQTTILPTARVALSMGVHEALPKSFGNVHKKFLTPTVSTVSMGAVSIVLYVIMNHISAGTVIADAVSAIGVMIALYYGMTGFSCAWFFRKTLLSSTRHFFIRGVLPTFGGLILYGALVFSFFHYWDPANSYTSWTLPFAPHWHMGGIFVIDVVALLIGVVLMFLTHAFRPRYFRGEVLNHTLAPLVPAILGEGVGLFGIDEESAPNK